MNDKNATKYEAKASMQTMHSSKTSKIPRTGAG